MISRKRRIGLSIIELVIVAGSGVILLGVLVACLLMTRKGEGLSERDAGLEAAILAQERITADLGMLVVKPGSRPLAIDPAGGALGLWTLARDDSPTATILADPVTYRVCAVDGGTRLMRMERSTEQAVGWPAVRDVKFQLVRFPSASMLQVRLRLSVEGKASEHCFAVTVPARFCDATNSADGLVNRFEPTARFPIPALAPGPD